MTSSSETLGSSRGAADAYDELADAYDVLTMNYCHDRWLERIEQLALAHGLQGRRLLDVACGTGKSFLPLAERGYAVTACDISPRMVEIARTKAPGIDIVVGDMRALDRLGEFDLITCLDDAVNYLLTVPDLEGFFDSLARNLAPDGVAVFDVNSVRLYREGFAQDWLIDNPEAFIAWTAPDAEHTDSGDQVAATVHVFLPDGLLWVRRQSRHEQRHWPQHQIAAAAAAASLSICAVHGQHRGACLEGRFDEFEHNKALCFAIHEERGECDDHHRPVAQPHGEGR
jgi:SAM-dependent methyltransferase